MIADAAERSLMPVGVFVSRLHARDQEDNDISFTYSWFWQALQEDFVRAAAACFLLEPGKLRNSVILSVLTVTVAYRYYLDSPEASRRNQLQEARTDFWNRAARTVSERDGEEAWRDMSQGLEPTSCP